MVPVLTIPESAFEPSGYSSNKHRSRLFTYLLQLTNGSAVLLTIVYLVAVFGLKPLLETTANRRLEVLEKFRSRLRDCYLSLVGKVSYIPIVAINKHDGSGKLYADAICQTDNSHLSRDSPGSGSSGDDKLGQNQTLAKLSQLSDSLSRCTPYLVSEIPHYKTIRYCVKDFQNKADTVFFNTHDIFTTTVEGAAGIRKKNISTETKTEIRSIKGIFISGKV